MADSIQGSNEATGAAPLPYPFSRNRLDPDPLYARLQRDEPVCLVQLPYGRPAWLVTTYELAKVVLGDPRFSREATLVGDNPRQEEADLQVAESILNMDPPQHTRIRHLVGKAFTARRVEQLRPRARQLAASLIDEMTVAGRPADLVQNFSFAFPASVICELLGIPEADRHQFQSWTAGLSSTSTVSPAEQVEIFLNLFSYFGQLFAQRRELPGDDLLTALAQARDNDDRLTEAELLFLGVSLLVGGRETTAHQITNMVYTLLAHPTQLARRLARMELQVSLETILSRLPGLRVAVPDTSLCWQEGTVMRSPTALPLCWDAGATFPHRTLEVFVRT